MRGAYTASDCTQNAFCMNRKEVIFLSPAQTQSIMDFFQDVLEWHRLPISLVRPAEFLAHLENFMAASMTAFATPYISTE